MAIDTSNMALPLPTKAQTATPTSPFQSTDPTKPAVGFAQAPQVDKVEAAKAEKFAWSPNQSNQGLDIGTARTMTENQRLQRTAQNQLNEQAKAEKLKVDQQIQTEDAAIAAIRSEMATLNGRMSSIKSEMTSVQAEIDRRREEARKAEEANRLAREAASRQVAAQPVYQAPAQTTPGGGWIGQDYYNDVNAARITSANTMAAMSRGPSAQAQEYEAAAARMAQIDAEKRGIAGAYSDANRDRAAALDREYQALLTRRGALKAQYGFN